ncbi:MAG: hypothetical protein PHN84_15905, partial [Desulfuromonadaceae bacterium]|nr:hypothetical protein [Desulfuromonadaceae bacterium]
MNSEILNNGFKSRLELVIGEEKPFPWANRIGLTPGVFNRMWNEGIIPKGDALLLISEKTGCSIDWLLTGEGEMKRGAAVDHVADAGKMITDINQAFTASPDLQRAFALNDPETCYKLLRDIIECYCNARPGAAPQRLSRDVVLIYRHFLDHYKPG